MIKTSWVHHDLNTLIQETPLYGDYAHIWSEAIGVEIKEPSKRWSEIDFTNDFFSDSDEHHGKLPCQKLFYSAAAYTGQANPLRFAIRCQAQARGGLLILDLQTSSRRLKPNTKRVLIQPVWSQASQVPKLLNAEAKKRKLAPVEKASPLTEQLGPKLPMWTFSHDQLDTVIKDRWMGKKFHFNVDLSVLVLSLWDEFNQRFQPQSNTIDINLVRSLLAWDEGALMGIVSSFQLVSKLKSLLSTEDRLDFRGFLAKIREENQFDIRQAWIDNTQAVRNFRTHRVRFRADLQELYFTYKPTKLQERTRLSKVDHIALYWHPGKHAFEGQEAIPTQACDVFDPSIESAEPVTTADLNPIVSLQGELSMISEEHFPIPVDHVGSTETITTVDDVPSPRQHEWHPFVAIDPNIARSAVWHVLQSALRKANIHFQMTYDIEQLRLASVLIVDSSQLTEMSLYWILSKGRRVRLEWILELNSVLDRQDPRPQMSQFAIQEQLHVPGAPLIIINTVKQQKNITNFAHNSFVKEEQVVRERWSQIKVGKANCLSQGTDNNWIRIQRDTRVCSDLIDACWTIGRSRLSKYVVDSIRIFLL